MSVSCKAWQKLESLSAWIPPQVGYSHTMPPTLSVQRPKYSKHPVSGFSLVELLTILAVVAVLAGASVGVTRDVVTGSGVRGAVSLAAGFVEHARTQAVVRGGGSRVIIDADPNSPTHLRRIAVIRGERLNSGGIVWHLAARPETLPTNAFFSEAYSDGAGTMRFDFAGGGSQNGNTGSEVRYFEYDAQGRLVSPPGSGLPRLVFVTGKLDGARELIVSESREASRQGFILRPAGNLTHFESPEQITRVNP